MSGRRQRRARARESREARTVPLPCSPPVEMHINAIHQCITLPEHLARLTGKEETS